MRLKFNDNPLVWLIAGGLAVWRITNIIQKEEIASPIRKAVGVTEADPEDSNYWIYPDNFIGKVFHCFWCGSVWIGAIITIILIIFPPLILPFALSALAIAFKSWLEEPSYTEVIMEGEANDYEEGTDDYLNT